MSMRGPSCQSLDFLCTMAVHMCGAQEWVWGEVPQDIVVPFWRYWLTHTKALPQLQSDQMIDNRSKYVQCFFCAQNTAVHQHTTPIAHILISVEILMNRIIIKTHWGEVGRASYKRNPSHETWAQLASQGAAQCVHIVMTIIVIIVVLPRDKSSGCSLLITTDTIMPKSQCHHFDSTILCLYISYSYLEFAFWDLFL